MATAINETEKLRALSLALGVRPRFHDRANFSFSFFRPHFFVAVRALLFLPHRTILMLGAYTDNTGQKMGPPLYQT